MRTCAFGLILVALLVVPAVTSAQNAPGITVPAGFRVEKLLEGNKCIEPLKIAFSSSGDLLVASQLWRILEVDRSSGSVSTLAKFATNRGPNPFDILVWPGGQIYFSSPATWGDSDPGIYRLDNGQATRVTPPGWIPSYLTQDGTGTLYAAVQSPSGWRGVAELTGPDADGQFDIDISGPLIRGRAQGLAFKDGFLYVVQQGLGARIAKYDTNGNLQQILASDLNTPTDLAIDSSGNLYTTVITGLVPEGLASFYTWAVKKISPDGVSTTLVDGIKGEGISIAIGPDDVPYLSEFDRGVVSKLVNGAKVDVTPDTGLNVISELAFDVFNRPHFSSFRFARLHRLDPDARSVEAVTPPLGYGTQTIAVDAQGRFFLDAWSDANWDTSTLFRVDPIARTIDTSPPLSFWSRALRFDASGRLVVTRGSSLSLLDFTTGQSTPYVTGNDLNPFLFDEDQNLFARHGRWEGIIKVNVPKDLSDPPFSVPDDALLFYDLTSKKSEIRYFDLNVQGQLLIPLVDTGEIVLGQADGGWSVFAGGFDWPGYVRFDRNGILYVVDPNIVYRIIGRNFVLPATSQRLHELETAVRTGVKERGLATSLTKELASAVASLEKGNIKAAVNLIQQFVNDVNAQKGKKIEASAAEMLVGMAESIKAGLRLL